MKKLLIILIVITGLYILFNNLFEFDWLAASGKQNESIPISNNIDRIEIDVTSINTTIIPENRDDLQADLDGKGNLKVEKDGDHVVVSVKGKWFDWFNWFSFNRKAKLTIYIPESFDRNMDINLGSGNLMFSGPAKNQPIKLDELALDIGSGNMELGNLKVTHFKHDGSSGNVKVDTLSTETGSFDISSGNLTINHYSGAIEADLSSGKLQLQMDKLKDSIEIDVSSGKVDLDLPDNADFTLNGEVSSGNIDCDFPLTTNNTSNKNVKGTHGSGKHKINLNVSSGNIDIY
jgi:lia operon protein LiaG